MVDEFVSAGKAIRVLRWRLLHAQFHSHAWNDAVRFDRRQINPVGYHLWAQATMAMDGSGHLHFDCVGSRRVGFLPYCEANLDADLDIMERRLVFCLARIAEWGVRYRWLQALGISIRGHWSQLDRRIRDELDHERTNRTCHRTALWLLHRKVIRFLGRVVSIGKPARVEAVGFRYDYAWSDVADSALAVPQTHLRQNLAGFGFAARRAS